MNVNDLNIFIALTKNGTIREAAHSTNNSTSRVSRVIRGIESEFGVKLFNRQANSLRLNEYGSALLEKAPNVVNDIIDIQATMEELRLRGEKYKLMSSDDIPAWFISNQLSMNMEKDVATSILKNYNEAIAMLKENAMDFLILTSPIEEKGLCCQFMVHDKLFLSVDPEDARFQNTRQISLHDGRIDKLLYFHVDGEFSNRVKKIFERLPKSTTLLRETNFLTYLFKLQRKGTITLSTTLTSSYKAISGRRQIPISDLSTSIDYYLIYKKSNRARVADVLELAKGWAKEYGPEE